MGGAAMTAASSGVNVVVATDLSVRGNAVALRAAQIAAQAGGRLGIVHVCSDKLLRLFPRLSSRSLQAVEAFSPAHAQARLDELAAQLQQQFAIDVHCQAVKGGVIAEIAAYVQQRRADLLVLGERQDGLIREILLGTHAEQLLGRVPCSMLLIRQPDITAYRHVLLSIKDVSNTLAWPMLRAVAPAALKWTAINVVESSRPRLGEETALAAELHAVLDAQLPGRDIAIRVDHGDPSAAILAQAQACHCDLIVMTKRPARRLLEVVRGSVVRQVVGQAPVDVLISLSD